MIRPGFRSLLLACAIGVLQAVINRPVLDFDWVYFDDDINVLLNPHLTGGSWETAKWAWTDLDYTRRYMPLGWLLFDGLLACGGLNAAVFHLAGWLLSVANGVLLFLVIRKITPPQETKPWWQDACAFIAVVVFSVHPWRAETTAWCSGLLYLAGQFLASLAVLAAWRPPGNACRQILPVVLFLLALLVYPVFLGLPLVLIVVEAGLRDTAGEARHRWLNAVRQYRGWLVVAAIVGGLNWLAAGTSRQGFAAVGTLATYPMEERWGHFAALTSHYLGRLFWPGDTAPFYGTATQLVAPALSRIAVWTALAAWTGLLAWPRTRRRAALALILFAACLLPFSGLLDQYQTANDRYAFLLLAVATGVLARQLARIKNALTQSLAMLGAVVLLAGMLPCYRQALTVWTDTDHLQARIDRVNAPHPNAQLSYAKPAITAWLLGHPEKSRLLLAAGLARLGPQPEILSAVEFIRQTDERISARFLRTPAPVPYALLHLELAQTHRAARHGRAARAHEVFAGRLEDKTRSISNPP